MANLSFDAVMNSSSRSLLPLFNKMDWSGVVCGAVFGIAVVCLCSCWWGVKKQKKSHAKVPNGRRGWPLIGETIQYITCDYVSFMQKRRSLYGKVFKTHILGRPVIVSTDPEINSSVMQNGRLFAPFYPKSVIELMGKYSILQIDADLHKRFHGLVSKFLKSEASLQLIAKDVASSLNLAFHAWEDKHRIYVQDETYQIAFPMLVSVLLGIRPGKELDLLKKEFSEVIKGIICVPIKFPGTRLYKSLKAKERMMNQIKEIIKEKAERNEEQAMTCVVDVLISEFHKPSDQTTTELISNIIIEMMIPGHHSVPILMTFALKYLSDSPAARKKLLEENLELKKKKSLVGDCYQWSDYMSLLPFTQNVIYETLRMANIVNSIWRKSLKDVEIKGYLFPKGWCVAASFSPVHYDENIYENPFEFNPWRWEGKGGPNQTTFTPFGGGQRLCPGYIVTRLEVSIFLHHFVTSFSWVAEDDIIVSFPTVKMKNRFPIIVSPISDPFRD
ncbi:3-epi-6-deoxocathasterone 23-monooxygenase CYP90C1-like [Curcuma longa]|uniref:3-epi-6-deoxocathasterone 23-monooxygenase CYP90C1-like n=1 Tax=Curcuma longa TaxID=136217 RepID=UPI003D9F1BCD